MQNKYTTSSIQDAVLQEIKDAGFVGDAIHRCTKIVIRQNREGVFYDITCYKDLSAQTGEITTTIATDKASSFLDNLKDTPRFSKDYNIRMALCEMVVTIEADKIPEVQVKYELQTKG